MDVYKIGDWLKKFEFIVDDIFLVVFNVKCLKTYINMYAIHTY